MIARATMNMLPNDHHPGPRCSCAECQRRYPEVSAPAQPTSKGQLAFALERVAIYRTHKTILLPYAGSMIALADEIERLQTQNSNLLGALNAKQAKIDALMLEFCPGEMSAEQRANWANSQQRAEFEPCEDYKHGWEDGASEATELLTSAGEPRAHRWDGAGERCLDCGDKDWMGGPCSGPRAAQPPLAEYVMKPSEEATFDKVRREHIVGALQPPSDGHPEFIRGAREGWMRAAVFYVDLCAEANTEICAERDRRWPSPTKSGDAP